ncbi:MULTISPECIES: glycoside hydrolase domain-containing protein [unclassified Crossiella]|uniref:glycoside hydrolase domain-containing protein n=1 Tax=unclassified Crossiella TaxID=2620835 RepID=UPI001FFEB991|nr:MULTISPECIES: glycoside hydrolase domain-containing protein [unclassified Crossiella]MCK2241392.1 DUF1906 domain-containing protein [Crossiella sp. S99.2]MCK2253464.1 DUF1906 domain-containing protein [Crossiella sp. S99.1]
MPLRSLSAHPIRGLVVLLGLTAGLSTPDALAEPLRLVDYRGYQVAVPGSWEVVDLDTAPRRCVRFDQNVVYLGRQGDQPICPSTVVGRTEALLIEPLAAAPIRSDTVTAAAGAARVAVLPESAGHEISMQVPAAGVLVTASYGDSVAGIRAVLDSARLTGRAVPMAARSVTEARPRAETWVNTPGDFTGHGFDTCAAPANEGMDTWLKYSPYRAVGIYIGGISKACGQRFLSWDWVHRQSNRGWRLLPVYVGLQAPCTGFRNKIDPANAGHQGWADGDDAAHQAGRLGIGGGSTIYNDMESFDPGNGECRDAVLNYLRSWIIRVHQRGYRTGVYSSAATGIQAVANAPGFPLPDHIWMAHWDGAANVESRYVRGDMWQRRRIKQYTGGHLESHYGWEIYVDSNFVDRTW